MSPLFGKKLLLLYYLFLIIFFRANSWLTYRHGFSFSLVFFASSNYILEVLPFIKFSKSSDDNIQNPGKMLDKYFPIRQFVAKLYYYQ